MRSFRDDYVVKRRKDEGDRTGAYNRGSAGGAIQVGGWMMFFNKSSRLLA